VAKQKGRKEVLEANGWKVYDTAWEAVGMSPAETELAETKFQMARRINYTKWRRDNLYENLSLSELNKKAAEFARDNFANPQATQG